MVSRPGLAQAPPPSLGQPISEAPGSPLLGQPEVPLGQVYAAAEGQPAQGPGALGGALQALAGLYGGIKAGVPGAGVLGGGAEALSQVGQHIFQDPNAPQTGTEAYNRMVEAALGQAGTEYAGQQLTRPVSAAGKILSGEKIAQRAAKTRALYTAATKDGIRHDPMELIEGLPALAESIAETSPAKARQLAKMAGDFISNKTGPITPLRVQEIKQAADKIAQKTFNVPRGTVQDIRQQFMRLVADNARRTLRQIPGAEQLEAATAKQIKLKVAAAGIPKLAGSIIGQLAGGYPGRVAGQMIGTRATEKIGETLSNPALLAILRQIPRGLLAGYQGLQ